MKDVFYRTDREFCQTLCWFKAFAAFAKSLVVLEIAGSRVGNEEYLHGAVGAYQGFLHFCLALMWLFPEEIPQEIKGAFIAAHKSTEELAAPDHPTSKMMQQFIGDVQVCFKVELLDLFREVRELYERSGYIYHQGGYAFEGSCLFDLETIIVECKELFPDVIGKILSSRTVDQRIDAAKYGQNFICDPDDPKD